MNTTDPDSYSFQVIPVDYAGAYATLARRVAAAHVFARVGNLYFASKELHEAMKVIEAVERALTTVTIAQL